MKKLLGEFKTFAFRGNIFDMAVGVMIAGAISKIVSSIVDDILMPTIGIITGGFDLNNLFFCLDGKSYATLIAAKAAGAATINYGTFLTYVVDFLIMAICIFTVMKMMVRLKIKKADEAPKTRTCPFCLTDINAGAVRCPNCTSQLDAVEQNSAEC